MSNPNKEKLFTNLEKAGEQTVRENLAQGLHGQRDIPLIQEWLDSKERGRQLDKEKESAERESRQIEISNSAKNAAWVAAGAAIVAI